MDQNGSMLAISPGDFFDPFQASGRELAAIREGDHNGLRVRIQAVEINDRNKTPVTLSFSPADPEIRRNTAKADLVLPLHPGRVDARRHVVV